MIDQRGRIIDALAMDTRGVIDVTLLLGRYDKLTFGYPGINGLVILFAFGAIGLGMGMGQKLRSN